MEKFKPSVSVVIPTYRHLSDCLIPCLESIKQFTDLSDIEILVVANGCGNDGTREYVESLGEPFKLIWVEEASGYTLSTNIGIKEAKGDVIILLNNDTILLQQEKHTWIKRLCEPLTGKIGVTGVKMMTDSASQRDFCIFFCVAIRRDMFEKIGLLNLEWAPGYGEDIEFCIKVNELGYECLQISKSLGIQSNMNITDFPIFHKPESTFLDDEHKEKWYPHVEKNRAKLIERYRLPEGAFWGDDIKEYRRLYEDLPDNAWTVELGTSYGRSLCSVADIIKRKNIMVYAVDTFEGTVKERQPGEQPAEYEQIFRDNIKRFGIEGNVEVVRSLTTEACKTFNDGGADLIFIDADHSYEAVSQDIDNWLPKLKKGGVISGHDYGGTWTGVAKAVNERWDNVRTWGLVWSKRI